MIKQAILLFLSIVASLFAWFLSIEYSSPYLTKTLYSFITITFLYLILIILELIISRKIKVSKARYALKKIISLLFPMILLIALIGIWVQDPQSLLVAYGILGAGVVVALQDLFKNFAGGVTIFVNGIYKAGDRIEINSKAGDVIDIGIFYTTLLEIKEWVGGDQATGRITTIPNSLVLSNSVNNYTKDHNFIWDEISIPITYDSDWKAAYKQTIEIVSEETKVMIAQSDKEILKLEEKYYLQKRPTEPEIFMKLTDNWISFNIRYISETRKRRIIHNKLSQRILESLQKSKNIKIASETLDITRFPEIKLKK